MNTALAVLAGYLLDGAVGDPPWLPHPVRGLGWLIAEGTRRLNRGGPARRLAAGAALAAGVTALAALAAWALVAAAAAWHPLAADAVTALGTGILLARRSLAEAAGAAVHAPLAAGDLPAARLAVGQVVGRDTADLDATEVARAALETLAENASDGVAAPLLFALAAGLPGIAAYKAINTLDSMIGHRDEEFLYFGRAAARLDDAANFVPARLTGLALAAAAAPRGRGAAAWRCALAGARLHKSPNAGWPEAAMAGALGVRLGGLNFYGGEPHPGPVFNPQGRAPAAADIPAATALVHRACHLLLAAGVLARLLI